MNSTGDNGWRRYQQFANRLAFPDPNEISLETGDEAYAIAQGVLCKLVGVLGSRFWLVIAGGLVTPSVFLVVALPIITQDGQLAWAANGRMAGEGPGAGSGVLVESKTSGPDGGPGPAGAGWYVVGTVLKVTA